MIRDCCPRCNSMYFSMNGHIHNGKQNHICNDCSREFVLNPEKKYINEDDRSLIKRLLLERISLRGICRVAGVSLTWLLNFIIEVYDELPDNLNVKPMKSHGNLLFGCLEAEIDELWSFV